MSRRASSGFNPAIFIGIAVVIAALFFGGKFLLGERDGKPLSGTTLDMKDAIENANSLRGNTYVVEGTIDDKTFWDPNLGQVISLKVTSPRGNDYLGIEIPPDLSKVNIEREQSYAFQVRFRQGGIPVAEQITRR